MSWTDRQREMLAAMGLRVWSAPAVAADASPAGDGDDHAAQATVTSQDDTEIDIDVAPAAAPAPAVARPVSAPPRARRDGGPGAVPADPTDPDAAARRHRIAALDWPALRADVAACRACGLCEQRRNTVFGVGHEQADWMIVGEAPGEQEDLRGEPFVGKAGQLLDAMLASIGLTRADAEPARQVFIANTLKCRPPRNRNPTLEEMQRCEPYLIRQVALVQPRVIVAMGRFAVQALLRSEEGIGRLRGRVHDYAGVPLVVTYHPAYLLRTPEDKAKAWQDLCLARSIAGHRPA